MTSDTSNSSGQTANESVIGDSPPDTSHDTTKSSSSVATPDTTSDTTEAETFLSVAAVSQRLGLNRRTAQRYAAKLGPSGIREANGSFPRLVSLEAMRRMQAYAASVATHNRDTTEGTGPVAGSVASSDTTGSASDTTPETVAPGVAELIEELRSGLAHEREETGRLHKALEQSQLLALGTMAEVQRWQQRAAELERQNAKLIEALPVVSEPIPDTAASLSGSPESEDNPVPGVITPPATTEGDSAPKRRGFWDRLLNR